MKKHNLYDVNLDRLTAFCTVCGFTEIFIPGNGKRAKPKPVCLVRAREMRVYQQDKADFLSEERRSRPSGLPHHFLSEINPVELTANCTVCGPTDIWKRPNAYNGKTYYRCGTKRREYMRKYQRSRYSGRPSNPHALSDIDEDKKTAVCAKCGRVKIVVWFSNKKINRRCLNVKSDSSEVQHNRTKG